ncbi:MAG: hypothetical protein KBT46_02540, partial [Ruminococcus sp.]|nr:hypothetical protein [Candidatus Copronaster equi]
EIEQPVFENNTAVVKYTSIDAEGKEVIVSTVVSRQHKASDNDSENNDSDNSNANNGSKTKNADNAGNNNQKPDNKETTTTVKAKVVTGKSTKASTKPYVAEKIDAELSMGMKVKQMFNTEDSKQRFLKNCNETYKITPEKAKSILEHGNEWLRFDYMFYVTNTTSKQIYVKGIKADNSEDLVVNSLMGCEYGFGPGKGMTMIFNGLFNNSKYQTDEELLEALKKANVRIEYTLLELDQYDVDDWSKVEVKTLPVNFE